MKRVIQILDLSITFPRRKTLSVVVSLVFCRKVVIKENFCYVFERETLRKFRQDAQPAALMCKDKTKEESKVSSPEDPLIKHIF